jgi:hypothetical protein
MIRGGAAGAVSDVHRTHMADEVVAPRGRTSRCGMGVEARV